MTEIPKNWSEVRLAEVAVSRMGKTILSKELTEAGLPVFSASVGAEPWGFIQNSDVEYKRGTIVISARGTIGDVKLPDFDRFVSTQTTIAATPTEAIDPRYLRHFLRCVDWPAFTATTAIPMLTIAKLNEISVSVPPLPEQRRIVKKVDGLSAKSCRVRDHLNHIPQLVEKYKQALLAAAFRGELTQEWRLSHQSGTERAASPSSIRSERDAIRVKAGLRAKGRNRNVPEKISDLAQLPLKWVWLTFDDCSWDMTVGHVGPMKDRYASQGIPFLRSLNVCPNHINTRKMVYIDGGFDEELAKSRLKPGDLVVVRTGEPGTAAVIPPEMPQANCSDLVICRLIPTMNPYFSAYYMNSEYAKSLVSGFQVGVAQQHFNVGAMSEMPVPFPSPIEQQEIVRRIETAFAWIDRLAKEAASARKLVDNLDQAVLAKAFRGELVPQDPNDEPASVLLERIKVERTGAAPERRRRPRQRVSSRL